MKQVLSIVFCAVCFLLAYSQSGKNNPEYRKFYWGVDAAQHYSLGTSNTIVGAEQDHPFKVPLASKDFAIGADVAYFFTENYGVGLKYRFNTAKGKDTFLSEYIDVDDVYDYPISGHHISSYLLCQFIIWSSGKYGITIPQSILGVKQDGIVGPKTLQVLNSYPDQEALFDKIKQTRKAFFNMICIDRPANRRFLKGWLNHLNDFKWIPVMLCVFLLCSCKTVQKESMIPVHRIVDNKCCYCHSDCGRKNDAVMLPFEKYHNYGIFYSVNTP